MNPPGIALQLSLDAGGADFQGLRDNNSQSLCLF